MSDSQGWGTDPGGAPAAGEAPVQGHAPTVPVAPTPPVQPGPVGLVYGDVANRVIAIVIDAILIGIVTAILQVFVGLVFGPAYSLTLAGALSDVGFGVNYLTVFIDAIVGIAVSFAYFYLLWTTQRATLGMRVLALQVGNETDGATITSNQAMVRWAALFGPAALSQAFWPVPGLGALIGLASFVWVIVLLVTTAQSPTKQGLHDRYAHTMVVKVVRTVA